MTEPEPIEAPTGERLEARIRWEIRRARGQRSDDQRPQDYSPIVFPECPGLCRAAYVVAGRMAAAEPDLLDAIEATREILNMLGVIDIMQNGGDGRHLTARRREAVDPEDLPPLGFAEDDIGRPGEKRFRG